MANSLPPEAVEMASRMYNAARQGDIEIFQQALPLGLPPNLTNEKGDTLVQFASHPGRQEELTYANVADARCLPRTCRSRETAVG